jgi:pilus assembly protein CpaE
VLVDDIAQTRETIVRTLRFQENFDVVGTASNGLQAIQLVRQLKPDVVVMDVNMPDMDGITATANIKRDLPNTEIVILTVQDDMDYMRRAMLAGARDFLAKPPMIDELVQAVERAGEQAHQQRLLRPALASPLPSISRHSPGKIVTVYSPRGGSGCTLLAVNLALGLHREENPAVIVDTDLQFGDVPVLFNTQSRLSILDLAPRVDELDSEIVSEVLVKHPSGVKILHPPRPERAELVTGPQLIQLSRFFATLFPYVILDTAHRLSDITLAALDVSDLIVLVSTLDIPSIARVRKFIELVPLLSLDPGKIVLVVNQFDPRAGIEPANLPQAFGIEHSALIPLANTLMIGSVNDGIPVLAKRANIQQPAGAALVELVKQIRQRLREMDRAPIRAVRT